MVSLLHSRGLLEDGVPVPRDGALSEVGRFVGRFVDVSRANDNRDEALARLAATTVGISGPPPLVAQAARALAASGVGAVRRDVDDAEIDIRDLDGRRTPTSGARSPHVAGAARRRRMAARADDTVPGVTACPSCLQELHPHPAGTPDGALAAYWLGLAVTRLTLAIAQIVVSGHPRGFQLVRRRNGELERAGRLATPLPGCEACGLAGPPVAHDNPSLVPSIYHAATALPGREFVSSRAHQMHYAVANINLAREERQPLLGRRIVELPEATSVVSSDLTVDAVATLLARIAGMVDRQGAPQRSCRPAATSAP